MPVLVSLLPVIVFLIVLNSLDTFKLLKPPVIFTAMLWGFTSALIAYPINNLLLSSLDLKVVTGFAAPVVEESLKYIIVAYMFYKNKLGFLADALIIGFAVGAGFSIIENIFYLYRLEWHNLMLWIIRGLGAALMHGTSTAIAAVIAQNLIGKREKIKPRFLLTGLFVGILIHAVFNNFLLSPLMQTILQISLLPVIAIIIFSRSENSLRHWMESQFESEFELMMMIKQGQFKTTKAGEYILAIKNRFDPMVIADMLAYIQLYLELSIKAKGMLLIQETGFDFKKEEEIKIMLEELNSLSKNIGKIGMRTLLPVINIKSKDLWKINLLK